MRNKIRIRIITRKDYSTFAARASRDNELEVMSLDSLAEPATRVILLQGF